MVLPAIIAAVLAVHPAPWKHVVVTRTSGDVSATLAYEMHQGVLGFATGQLRHATLLVRRRGVLVIDRRLDTSWAGHASLVLRNVWGDPEPEALAELTGCGNRCGYALYVGIAATRVALFHNFGVEIPKGNAPGWTGQRRGDVFEFVTDDSRFFCEFADCASSTMPVQVLAVSTTGRRFVDVSRTRTDLLVPDARSLWLEYLQERKSKNYEPLGALVPYCADEYRLDITAYCDRVLPAEVKRRLAGWGYR